MACAYPSRGSLHNRAVPIALALLIAAPANAQYENFGAERAATFDTGTDPAFGDPTRGLRALMRDYPTHRRGPQHFCVVGYAYRDGERDAYVHWREGRRRVLWEAWEDPTDRSRSITLSRRNLDLDKDVVSDGPDNTSVYAITRSELRDTEVDCAAHGRTYTLNYPRSRQRRR